MNVDKIVKFCKLYGIDSSTLDVYPGWKREIIWTPPEEIMEKIVPDRDSDPEAFDTFCDEWWHVTNDFGSPGFNIYYDG